MTIICAYTDGKKTWIGSDTQVTGGNHISYIERKWCVVGSWASGDSGSVRTGNVLEQYKDELLGGLNTPWEFSKRLQERFEKERFHPDLQSRGDEGGPIDWGQDILLAKPGKIWVLDSELGIVKFGKNEPVAYGCGFEYALGAGYVAREAGIKGLTIVEYMLESAVEYDPYCGGKLWTWELY